MESVKLDTAGVRALAERVLDLADQLDEIGWPAIGPTDMTGSVAAAAAASTAALARNRLTEVVARMRSWATSVSTAVTAIEQTELGYARRLDEPR